MSAPYWSDDHLTIHGGDCREVMASMPERSVHCVVTSPPYWGLRDYGQDGQLGLEATPDAYVEAMVGVFREVRRVLRDDGTVWLNLGDSYATSNPVGRRDNGNEVDGRRVGTVVEQDGSFTTNVRRDTGLKGKDLVGIPWRVAFALQADGWYLRSDIIWSKPNPMPESVTDRPTKAHEYLFLLSKSPRYYYDADAVREPHAPGSVEHQRYYQPLTPGQKLTAVADDRERVAYSRAGNHEAGRNLRSVWNIATEPYPGAHFATFPRKLVEPCIKAGTSERGVCPECGEPWVRVVERGAFKPSNGRDGAPHTAAYGQRMHGLSDRTGVGEVGDGFGRYQRDTTGWRPSCAHDAEPIGPTVLDPFAGSGTTLLVAQALGRRAVGIDLNPDYLRQCLARNAQTPLGLGA